MGFKRCGETCGIFGGAECKERRQCSCTVCSGLEGIDLSLAEACHKACNATGDARPKTQDEFLCNSMTGEDLFTRFHIIRCGFNPEESTTRLQQKEAQGKIDQQNKPLQITIFVLILAAIGSIYYLVKK
jgi:hypothetical protein